MTKAGLVNAERVVFAKREVMSGPDVPGEVLNGKGRRLGRSIRIGRSARKNARRAGRRGERVGEKRKGPEAGEKGNSKRQRTPIKLKLNQIS